MMRCWWRRRARTGSPGAGDFATDFPVRDWTANLGLVTAGLGATLVPSLATAAARPELALATLDPRDAPPRRVHAATLRGITLPPATGAFIAALRASAVRLRNAVRVGTSRRIKLV